MPDGTPSSIKMPFGTAECIFLAVGSCAVRMIPRFLAHGFGVWTFGKCLPVSQILRSGLCWKLFVAFLCSAIPRQGAKLSLDHVAFITVQKTQKRNELLIGTYVA